MKLFQWILQSLQSYSNFAEKPLLHAAVPLCEEFNIKWSSFENAPPSSKGHEVILQTTEPQTFWTPSPPARDPQPCLEVAFIDNHVVTAIELKGNAVKILKHYSHLQWHP